MSCNTTMPKKVELGAVYSGVNPHPYSTHSIVARAIGRNKSVLDIGCNKGYLKAMAATAMVPILT